MTLTPALSSLFTAATGWAATTRTGDRRSTAPLRAARGPRHPAPEDPLTITEAHRLMQQHLYCTVHGCATKAAAFELLVDVGHIAPDRSYFFGRS